MTNPVERVFGNDGILAKAFKGYTKREGQFAFSSAVQEAIAEGEPLVAEAATGTGKSFGYLVPSIYAVTDPERKRRLVARRPPPENPEDPVWIDGMNTCDESPRVLVVTAGLSLQDQLVKKDLPFLQKHLPWPFRFQVAKGKTNFLCRDKLAQASVLTVDEADVDALDQVTAWARKTDEGDLAELPFEPSPSLKRHLTVSGQECHGSACDYRAECFAYRAREAAGSAEVVVANYQLFFAHLAVVGPNKSSSILPRYDILVLDECQHVESIARSFFGFTVSPRELRETVDMLHGRQRLKDAFEKEMASFFDGLAAHRASPAYASRLREAGVFAHEGITRALRGTAEALQGVANQMTHDGATEPEDEREKARLRRGAATLKEAAKNIEAACHLDQPERTVYHLPEERGTILLKGEPLEPGGILRGFLWAAPEPKEGGEPRPPPVTIAASATLSTTDDATEAAVRFMANRMGAQGAKCLVVKTPFDLYHRVMICYPAAAPDPSSPNAARDLGPLFAQAIRASKGRTLGLFTSRRVLDIVTAHVRKELGSDYLILKQGEAPRGRLVDQFRADIPSCLFGLKSFWAGVDVPGRACVQVAIDRIPFDPPDDPILDAMKSKDPKAFYNYSVPRAILDLRQGFGRLVRSEGDYGVVTLFDSRFIYKSWAKKILHALPATDAVSLDLADIPAFLRKFEGDST